MRDLEQHLTATKARVSRRASIDHAGLSSSRSVPTPGKAKMGRRSSLSSGTFIASNNSNNSIHQQPAVPKKKQARRASLGQMLGNAQKFFTTKDDAATVASDESGLDVEPFLHERPAPPSSSSSNASQALVLLDEVEELIQHHVTRRVEMEVTLESDLELAKARLQSGNQLGAILSMRRVHKNTTLLAYTSAAKYQLTQIREALLQARQEPQAISQDDLQEHKRQMREITEKLLHVDTPTPTDAFLLNQLEAQMEQVGV